MKSGYERRAIWNCMSSALSEDPSPARRKGRRVNSIEQIEWWIAHAKPNAELVILNRGDPERVAQQHAGFAAVFEILKKAQDGKTVYLETDHQGRTVVTKVSGATAARLDAARNIPDDGKWGALPEQPEAHREIADAPNIQPMIERQQEPAIAHNGTFDYETYKMLLETIQKHGSTGFNKKCDQLGVDPKLALEAVNHQALKEVRARSGGR